MTANDGSGNNPARDEWETPRELFQELYNQYKFTFDCCANKQNHKVWQYSHNFLDMIDTKGSICWMNPPFSRSTEMFKQFFKVVHRGVAIYRCDNIETKLWYNIFKNATWVFIPNKRIEYEGIDGKGSRFPSALIGFNVAEPIGLQGTTLKITSQYTEKGNK